MEPSSLKIILTTCFIFSFNIFTSYSSIKLKINCLASFLQIIIVLKILTSNMSILNRISSLYLRRTIQWDYTQDKTELQRSH